VENLGAAAKEFFSGLLHIKRLKQIIPDIEDQYSIVEIPTHSTVLLVVRDDNLNDQIYLALGLSQKGVDTQEGKSAHLIMLLLSSTKNPGLHLIALKNISAMISKPGFVAHLTAAHSPNQAHSVFKRYEVMISD
jgi:mannitol/fructose-specific phosphotransferase system IIA component (Ntr-type)